MMDILGKLFGSTAKVKIIRLFLLNPEQGFDAKDVAARSRIPVATVRREIAALEGAGFLKKKSFIQEIIVKKKKKEIIKKKRVQGFFFNAQFKYRDGLRDLVLDTEFVDMENLTKKFKTFGKIKLVLAAGVFTRDPESRLDLLIVGDNMKKSSIDTAIRTLEAEIGKELAYAVFDTPDFLYRANMYDKLIRDVIDYPHQKLVDIGILDQIPKTSPR